MTETLSENARRERAWSTDDLALLDAWWRAANYLAVGQIYLVDNPLLREPLRPEHLKPRLLGHWGTTPGLTFVWAHLNRVIARDGPDALFVAGPGHGGPAVVATAWLEGTYSERYAHAPQDANGMKALFRQFSFPGGVPSHASPETPGSIHEGGELGYSLAHAYGAVLDNPELLVACVIGDGEAETGPLATSWQSNKFVHPVHDGTVLPILHLNGYKIANSTVLARIPEDELLALMEGSGTGPTSSTAASTGKTRWPCTPAWPRRWTRSSPRSPGSGRTRRSRTPPASRWTARAGRCWCCAHRRAGRGRARSTGRRSRARGGPTRCRSPRSATTPRTVSSWRRGCGRTGRRNCSTTRDGSGRSSPPWRRRETGG